MKNIKNLISKYSSDSLFKNSSFLMLTTVTTSGLGFLFWTINTKLYSSYEIGIATTFISVMSFIMNISLLGFNYAFIRFLYLSKDRNGLLSTTLSLIAVFSLIIASFYLIFISHFSPLLEFFIQWPYSFIFIAFMVIASLNMITDTVFIALRSTQYVFINNVFLSLVKLIIPFFLVAFGLYGLIASVMISTTAALILSLIIFVWKFDFKLKFHIKKDITRQIWKFSGINYISGLMSIAPSTLIPILITNHLGASATAYYFMPTMIISLLQSVPRSFTSSLFAEGAFDEKILHENIRKSFVFSLMFLVPSVLFILLFGTQILTFFGKAYSSEGQLFLKLSSLTILLCIPNYIVSAIINIKRKPMINLQLSIVGTISLLILTVFLLNRGIVAVAFSSIITQIILLILSIYIYKFKLK